MRRMRTWYILIPVAVVALGLGFWVQRNPFSISFETTSQKKTMRFPDFSIDTAVKRDVASVEGTEIPHGADTVTDPQNDTQITSQNLAAPSKALQDDIALMTSTQLEPLVKGQCSSVEFPGAGPAASLVSREQWTGVMKVFHQSKADLLKWLQNHKTDFSEKTFGVMDKQIRGLMIRRPPTAEEPDLSWRGIAVWGVDNANAPVVRLGGGFVQLLKSDPARARFELTRLVAQSWAPCELERVQAGYAWAPLLKCLNVTEGIEACGSGKISEAGWAVSSALAFEISQPGCKVPALAEDSISGCVKNTTYRDLASVTAPEQTTNEPATTDSAEISPKEGQ